MVKGRGRPSDFTVPRAGTRTGSWLSVWVTVELNKEHAMRTRIGGPILVGSLVLICAGCWHQGVKRGERHKTGALSTEGSTRTDAGPMARKLPGDPAPGETARRLSRRVPETVPPPRVGAAPAPGEAGSRTALAARKGLAKDPLGRVKGPPGRYKETTSAGWTTMAPARPKPRHRGRRRARLLAKRSVLGFSRRRRRKHKRIRVSRGKASRGRRGAAMGGGGISGGGSVGLAFGGHGSYGGGRGGVGFGVGRAGRPSGSFLSGRVGAVGGAAKTRALKARPKARPKAPPLPPPRRAPRSRARVAARIRGSGRASPVIYGRRLRVEGRARRRSSVTSHRALRRAANPLRAGEIDDNEKFGAYLSYHKANAHLLPVPYRIDISERYTLEVVGTDGKGLPNCRIAIAGNDKLLWRGRTDAA